MNDGLITCAFILLAAFNWSVAALLTRLGRRNPRIRALTERAVLATLIAIVTTAYAGVVANTSAGYPLMDLETARNLVRVAVFALGLYPVWWVWSYYKGRF